MFADATHSARVAGMTTDTPPEGLELVTAASEALAVLRERSPRVHVITNTVAQPLAANLLVAAGAIPSMTVSAEEVPDFVARADALAVNLGTLDGERRSAISGALDVAAEEGVAWVLDPVFVDVSPTRLAFAREILVREPWVLRGNPAEIAALSGADAYAPEVADRLAMEVVSVVVATGPSDLATNGTRRAEIRNGSPMLAQVSGTGCAGTALTGAFLAVTNDPLVAAVAALLMMGIAAENAVQSAEGPGSFAWRLIDAVHALSPADIVRRARLV